MSFLLAEQWFALTVFHDAILVGIARVAGAPRDIDDQLARQRGIAIGRAEGKIAILAVGRTARRQLQVLPVAE